MADEVAVLRAAEAQMLEEATTAAWVAYRAIDRMRHADAVLAELRKPSWGREVAEWHRAAEALTEALQVVAAYREFEPNAWWGSWR